jgi:putative nucleotidyltransferase with HDIG domain
VLDDPHAFLDGRFAPPPPPTFFATLLDTLAAGHTSPSDVAGTLAGNSRAAGHLLGIVNSKFYGLPSPVRDLRHAAAYLGTDEIKRVALTVAVMEQLRPMEVGDFRRFWFHAFHTALAARLIARQVARNADTEQLHLAALLHDLGKLVYLVYFPDAFTRLDGYRRRRALLLADAEQSLGLPAHTLLGATLCDHWGFPGAVRRACESHELEDLQRFLDGARVDDETRIVCVANLLSNLCTEELTEELKGAIQQGASRALGFNETQFLLLMGELYDRRPEVKRFVLGL